MKLVWKLNLKGKYKKKMQKKYEEHLIKFDDFDVIRDEDQLIVYTKNNIIRNSYGFEAAINDKGLVVEIGSTVLLPLNGYVISGHGKAHKIIEQFISVGNKIELNESKKEIKVLANKIHSLKFYIELKLNEITEKYSSSQSKLLDLNYNQALEVIEDMKKIKVSLKNLEEESEYKNIEDKFNNLFETAYQHLTKSEVIDARGVWHRPKENNLDELIKLLNDLEATNINEIYVETLWNGYTIYPSDIIPYHPVVSGDFGEYGNNYLKALISEAKKRNINVHAWVENFFVGAINAHSELWENHPEWQIINYNGLTYQTGKPGNEEEGFLFFDPANPEVQNLVIEFYKELVTNYQLNGLQLDYIRYPAGNANYLLSSGYTEYAINKFIEDENLDNIEIKEFVKEPNNYKLWNNWRQKQITNFVERVYHEVININSDLFLSIAVGPDADYAKINLMQDWRSWVQKGWIDIVAPMAYVRSSKDIETIVSKMNDITNEKTFNYTGVAPTFDKLPNIFNTYFIDESRKTNALGAIIFAYHNLEKSEEVKCVLKRGTHRKKAIPPHNNVLEIYKVFIENLKNNINNIYLPNKQNVVNNIDKILEVLTIEFKNESEIDNVKHLKEHLTTTINLIDELDENEVYNRIKEQVLRLNHILIVKTNRWLIRKELKNE